MLYLKFVALTTWASPNKVDNFSKYISIHKNIAFRVIFYCIMANFRVHFYFFAEADLFLNMDVVALSISVSWL
jgi:hypothetical protein